MLSRDCLNEYISVHPISMIKLKQDRQGTYNVTLRRVRATVVVEKEWVIHNEVNDKHMSKHN